MSNEKEQKKQFLVLYENYADELFRYCFFKTSNREVSLEIVQEVFMKTWKGVQKGVLMDNPKAFLYASTRNSVIDWYRKKKPISLDAMNEEGFDAPYDTVLITSDMSEASRIISMTSKLDEKHREVILLRFVSDLPVGEIALLLKESENVVSVRIHRALGKLRKLYIKK